MESVFSRIISGQLPCYKIFENDYTVAILDISPIQIGHTLVIPKTQVDKIYDLDDKMFFELFSTVKMISKTLEKCTFANRIGMMVIGFDISHAHIHLIPINKQADLQDTAKTLDGNDFIEVLGKIKSNL
jgi:histidine triad (HIT) family protein